MSSSYIPDQASDILTDTTNFNKVLSTADTDTQKALETIDEITAIVLGAWKIDQTTPQTSLGNWIINNAKSDLDFTVWGINAINALISADAGLMTLTFRNTVTSNNFISDVAIGTSPYACTSTTLNTNLNSDLLDGYHASGLGPAIDHGSLADLTADDHSQYLLLAGRSSVQAINLGTTANPTGSIQATAYGVTAGTINFYGNILSLQGNTQVQMNAGFYVYSSSIYTYYAFTGNANKQDIDFTIWGSDTTAKALFIDASANTINFFNTKIGFGVANIDYTLTFDGETNDGIITWMEDEDYFKFSDGILVNSTEEIFFRDSAIYINSIDDGHLDLTADTQIDLNAITLATDKIIFTQTDGNEYIDSLNDGYMDYYATTGHRFNTSITSTNFISNIAIGTSPYACTSTTLNTNLNADFLDGYHYSDISSTFWKVNQSTPQTSLSNWIINLGKSDLDFTIWGTNVSLPLLFCDSGNFNVVIGASGANSLYKLYVNGVVGINKGIICGYDYTYENNKSSACSGIYIPRKADLTSFLCLDYQDDFALISAKRPTITTTITPSPSGTVGDIYVNNDSFIYWNSGTNSYPIVIEIDLTSSPLLPRNNAYFQLGLTFRSDYSLAINPTHIKIETWNYDTSAYVTAYDSDITIDTGYDYWLSPGFLSASTSSYILYKLKITLSGTNPLSGVFRIQRVMLYHPAGEWDPWKLNSIGDTIYGNFTVSSNNNIYFRDTGISINSNNDGYLDLAADTGITINNYLRHTSANYRRYYHLPIQQSNPGASGATWITPSVNTVGGWKIDSASELLYLDTDIHADWDGASDLKLEIYFAVNIDNTGGGVGDTVDLKLQCFYNTVGDTAIKSQTVEVATVVGQAAQYKVFKVDFTIDWDYTSNVVEVGDIMGMILNLETDTSEVDDIIILHSTFYYNTKHIGIESGDV